MKSYTILFFFLFLLGNNANFISEFKVEDCVSENSEEYFNKFVDNTVIKTLEISESEFCYSSNCRHWPETTKIAFCKALLVANRLKTSSFELIKVKLKTESKSEYSDFLFSVHLTNNFSNGFLKTPSKIEFRMCIPVNRELESYIDMKCPYERCGLNGNLILIHRLYKTM